MFTIFSLCISSLHAAPYSPTSNLSLYLQQTVRNTPHDQISEYLDAHGWGSPLREPAEYPLHKSSDKDARNAYAGEPNRVETSNFVIWYGTPDGFSEQNVESLSIEMEYIWTTLINDMEYPTPESTDAWKFNVYIGDTGSGVPSAEGAAGYFWYDPENYPMIVLSKDIVSWTDSAKLTGGHEFYHAVQAAIDTYRFNDSALWWHEATSNWILEELYRDEGGYSNTLYSVALRPEIALNHWGDYATEGVEADHHYGASIFGTFLSEFRGGPELIKRSFMEAPLNSDPLDVFETLLQEDGESLVDAHLEYALRNTTWDYEFEKRGTVFAPVAFADNRHVHYSYRYRPDYCIDIGANFFVHLFFRDNCSQYYFGDYYDNQLHNNHYHSWVNRRNLRNQYDPLMAHYCGRSHRYNDFPLLNWIDTQHRYYETYRNLRPQISLSAHINLTASPNHHDRKHDDYFRRSKLANRYSDRDNKADRKLTGNQTQQPRNKDDRSSKPIRVNDRDHQQLVKANQIAKQKSDRRKKSEARAAENQLAADKTRAQAAQKQRERDLEKQNRDLEREQKLAEIKQKSAENKLARQTRSSELKRKQELERQAKLKKELPPSQTATSNTRPPTNSLSRTQQKEIEKAAKKKADEIKRAQQQQVLAQQRAERDEKSRIARQEYEQKKMLRESQANAERERSRAATQQKIAEAKRAAQIKDQQRAAEKAQRDRESASRRAQLQAKLAQEKAQRAAKDQAKEAQRQADKARRDRETQQRRAETQAKKENRKKK